MKKILVIPLVGLGCIVIPLLCKYAPMIVYLILPGPLQRVYVKMDDILCLAMCLVPVAVMLLLFYGASQNVDRKRRLEELQLRDLEKREED